MENNLLPASLDFNKSKNGLIPVIIQDARSGIVLMLGYMNAEALDKTITSKLVTFFSRSKNRLWTKGETSNNFLHVHEMIPDCDNDTLLIKAIPDGPVCHTGADTCFGEENAGVMKCGDIKVPKEGKISTPNTLSFLADLENIIESRKTNPGPGSYTSSLFEKGINAVAQKVGEEAVELIIEAKDNNEIRFKDEAADLLFHYMVLLRAKGFALEEVIKVLETRHGK